jgi:hypothetical protein
MRSKQHVSKQPFVWTEQWDKCLTAMKEGGTTTVEITEYVNHQISLGNEKKGRNTSFVTLEDVVSQCTRIAGRKAEGGKNTPKTITYTVLGDNGRKVPITLIAV